MNWYKKAQDVYNQYDQLDGQLGVIIITGTGQGETLNIMGQTVSVRQILDQAVATIRSVLIDNGVKEIDTSPLDPMAQGLAVSNEPGKIHIDVKKIVDNIGMLPSNVQNDGVEVDQDKVQGIVEEVKKHILSEIGGTIAHESQHMRDYRNVARDRGDFSTVQEAPGPAFEQKIRQQYF